METTGSDLSTNGTRRGLLAGLMSAAAFALMAQLVKEQSATVPSSQIAFARGLVGVLLLTPLAYWDLPKLFRPGSLFVWLRSFAGGVGVVVFFLNIKLSLASNARAISNVAPVLTGLLAFLFFKQRPRPLEAMGLLVVVGGAIMLRYSPGHPLTNDVLALGLVHAAASSLAHFSLKQASRDYSTSLIVWAFCASVAISAYFSPAEGRWVAPDNAQLAGLVAGALAGLVGQWLLTTSHFNLDNTLASALTLLAMPMNLAWECWIQGRSLSSVETWSYGLILGGLLVKIFHRRIEVLWHSAHQ